MKPFSIDDLKNIKILKKPELPKENLIEKYAIFNTYTLSVDSITDNIDDAYERINFLGKERYAMHIFKGLKENNNKFQVIIPESKRREQINLSYEELANYCKLLNLSKKNKSE